MPVADLGDGGVIATTHAGRAHDPHVARRIGLKFSQQLSRPGLHAGQAVADPHGQRRHFHVVVGGDIEMGVEGRDFIDLDEGQFHQVGQRRQMARRQAVMGVLEHMQILDEEIAAQRRIAE